jgi:hypothetical protein
MFVPVSVTQAAQELYALPPTQFRAARDERAAQARAAGQRDTAAQIKRLSRPTVSAWLVNQLARHAAEPLGEWLDLGEQLREAQRTLAGGRLTELSRRRRELAGALTAAAGRLAADAGAAAGPQVMREVEGTLDTALADPDAAALVRSGQLAKPLSYAGLGTVDLGAPAATAAGPPGDQPGAQRRRPAAPRAEQQAREAQRALEEADQQLAALDERQRSVRGLVASLEQQLRQARREAEQVSGELTRARRSRDAAARSLAAAQRRMRSSGRARER